MDKEKQTNEKMISHPEQDEIANSQSTRCIGSEQQSENEIAGLVLFFFFMSLLSFLLANNSNKSKEKQ